MADGMRTSTSQMAVTGLRASNISAEFRGMLNHLMGDLDPLAQTWKGAASARFGDVKARYNEDVSKLCAALEGLASALGTANTTYSTTDSDQEQAHTQVGANAGSITASLQVL